MQLVLLGDWREYLQLVLLSDWREYLQLVLLGDWTEHLQLVLLGIRRAVGSGATAGGAAKRPLCGETRVSKGMRYCHHMLNFKSSKPILARLIW